MSGPVLGVLATAALFLLILPAIGAFGVRYRWRRFRAHVLRASCSQPLTYASLHSGSRVPESQTVRIVGSLESIQGEHTLWVRSSQISVATDMARSAVYVVSSHGPGQEDTVPMRTSWNRMGSLPEGARVLVCGRLDVSGAHPVIRAPRGEFVAAIFFDGPDETLVRRSIWSGRQANEYWNSVTPSSLAGATISLLLWAYVLLQQQTGRAAAQLAIALATVPVLPLLPPAVGFFYVYRLLWRRGRRYRALRDVVALPERFLAGDQECGDLPGGGRYCRWQVSSDEATALVDAGVFRVPIPASIRGSVINLYGNPDTRSSREPADVGHASRDALAEPMLVEGEPARLVLSCRRRARMYELASTAILAVGLLANFIIALLILGLLL